MIWKIVYSEKARQDLRDIYGYIAYELLAPSAAEGQVQRIMKTIRTLDQMPMRHKLYQDEPWKSRGIRFVPIDNYIVFYQPEEMNKIVNIFRIMYAGRDVSRQLEK